MAGLEHAARGRILEEHVRRVLEALTRRAVRVARPRGARHARSRSPIPRRMLFVGGGVPAAARRRARLRLLDVPDERRRGRARRVLRRGARRSASTAASCCSRSARRSCTSPTIPRRRGPRSASTCCTRRRPTRRSRRRASTRRRACTRPRSTTSRRRRSTSSARRTRCSPASSEVPDQRRHRVPPARGRPAAGARLVEPGTVRGQGAAAAASGRSRVSALWQAQHLGVPSSDRPFRGGPVMARYRNFDGTLGAGTDAQALPRARRRAVAPGRPEGGTERSRARAARHRLANRVEWVTHVRDALDVVHEVWTRHIVETEAPGAFLDELVTESPRLVDADARGCGASTATSSPRSSAPRSGSRPAAPRTTPTSRGPRTCASSSPRCSPPWPVTASAAPTSSTRPTPSTSAAATERFMPRPSVALEGCVCGWLGCARRGSSRSS